MGSIYQADVWCDECTDEIKKAQNMLGTTPNDPDNQYSYDSDEYPKDSDVTCESDTPQHCAGCQEFLENDLTTDGAEYVFDAVRDDIAAGHHDSTALHIWMPFYDWIDFGPNGRCDHCGAWTNELQGYECSGCAHRDDPNRSVDVYALLDELQNADKIIRALERQINANGQNACHDWPDLRYDARASLLT